MQLTKHKNIHMISIKLEYMQTMYDEITSLTLNMSYIIPNILNSFQQSSYNFSQIIFTCFTTSM